MCSEKTIALAAGAALLVLFAGCAEKPKNILGTSPELRARGGPVVGEGVPPRWSPDRNLLIVDDTRLFGDQVIMGQPAPPAGLWPTAAELDTFLYARGGFPWKGYPEGTLSEEGIFAGYDFDTIGTRIGRPDLTVPIGVLSRYRRVVWIVDSRSATFQRDGFHPTEPQTALRYMSQPGHVNTLADYVAGGGKLWLLGGGAGFTATIDRNRLGNDQPVITFSAPVELRPGAFMYDHPHWRSSFRSASVVASVHLSGALPVPNRRYHYSLLPPRLEPKSPATDPLPPFRTSAQFYPTHVAIEYLREPNDIIERENPLSRSPNGVLDSLYQVDGAVFDPRPENVCMTNYHGQENGGVVFTGFDIWSWRRSQCRQLVDAVLQGIWRMQRAPSEQSAGEPVVRTGGGLRP